MCERPSRIWDLANPPVLQCVPNISTGRGRGRVSGLHCRCFTSCRKQNSFLLHSQAPHLSPLLHPRRQSYKTHVLIRHSQAQMQTRCGNCNPTNSYWGFTNLALQEPNSRVQEAAWKDTLGLKSYPKPTNLFPVCKPSTDTPPTSKLQIYKLLEQAYHGEKKSCQHLR